MSGLLIDLNFSLLKSIEEILTPCVETSTLFKILLCFNWYLDLNSLCLDEYLDLNPLCLNEYLDLKSLGYN